MICLDPETMQELWNKDSSGFMPVLLDIYNPNIVWTEEEINEYNQDPLHLRVISDVNRVVYQKKTYLPCAFSYQPPDTDGKKIGTASITISALDSRVRKVLRNIRTTSQVKVVAMFVKKNKDESTEQTNSSSFVYKFKELNSVTLDMVSASANNSTATFNLVFKNVLSQNIPYQIATQDRTPSVSI